MPSLGEIELCQTAWGAFLGNMAISDWYLKNRFFLNLDKIQKRVLGGKLIVNKANKYKHTVDTAIDPMPLVDIRYIPHYIYGSYVLFKWLKRCLTVPLSWSKNRVKLI